MRRIIGLRMTTILLDPVTDERLQEMTKPREMSEFLRRLVNKEWYRRQAEQANATAEQPEQVQA